MENMTALTAPIRLDDRGNSPRVEISGRYSIAWPSRSTGLGNRLFPWARCEITSRDLSLTMLAPKMANIRRGAFFRGGIDYRHFLTKTLLWDNFNFRNYVRGVKRLAVLLSHPRIPEERVLSEVSAAAEARPADGLVVFRGYADLFVSLRGENAFLLDNLRRMTKPKWIEQAAEPEYVLGVNIRLGRDFSVPTSAQDMQDRGLILTPIEWFAKAIEEVQKRIGRVSCLLVSDGNQDALRPILELPNVRFFRGGSAISDLLCLAKCSALIGTGGSSFTAWAAYLANAPVLTHAGQSLRWFGLDKTVPFVGVYPGPDIERFSELLFDRMSNPLTSS
jgi:hypothetical protein